MQFFSDIIRTMICLPGVLWLFFSGGKRYAEVTNANLDNTGLAYFLPLLHKKCGLLMNKSMNILSIFE